MKSRAERTSGKLEESPGGAAWGGGEGARLPAQLRASLWLPEASAGPGLCVPFASGDLGDSQRPLEAPPWPGVPAVVGHSSRLGELVSSL